MQQTLHVGSLRVANWTGTDLTMSAPAPPVLRGDATLVGQILLDVVKAVRGEAPLLEEALLARFEADVPPRSLSDDELAERLETLTGENSGFLLDMTGKDLKAHETIVRLAHFLIMAANDAAAPRQPIRSSKAGKTAAQAVANLLDPTDEPPRETRRHQFVRPPSASQKGKASPTGGGLELKLR